MEEVRGVATAGDPRECTRYRADHLDRRFPGVVSTLVRSYLDRLRRGETLPASVLTGREDEVVKLIAEGHSTHGIAGLLTISIKTVERHRANILEKLGLRDRTQLTRYAIRRLTRC
jgi:DNA-binding NarL/FixJ family response regulator